MCGIAGYVDLAEGPSEAILRNMASEISHRGPDADGIWCDDEIGLVHTRLSIIDLSESIQPMSSRAGAITFNGEIYNYRQLRSQLTADFVTHGDTEVLLHGVDEHGLDFLDRIDGMFSFGHWDLERRCLLLARDRFGKKPLFVSQPRPDLLVFGSEPKALLQHPEVDRSLDQDALREVVRYRAVYGTQSLYSGITQIPPGHALEWRGGDARISEWFDAADLVVRRGEADDQSSLEREFMESVEARLVSDVPVGAFLSGGIDSSLVVAAMRRLKPKEDIHTFSVSFEGDPDDEHEFASTVADRFETIHHRVVVGQSDFIADMGRYSRIRDAPLSEPADLAVARMSGFAREHVKVVLSGEGADEAFAGYPKYQLAGLHPWLVGGMSLVPIGLAMRLARVAGVSERRVNVALQAIRQPNELARISQWFSAGTPGRLQSVFPRLWRDFETQGIAQKAAFDRVASRTEDPVRRMQFVDLVTWLPGNLLERGDRMTMAEGLEARMPFMSAPMMKIGLGLRSSEKCSMRVTKKPLRDLAEKMVGADIARRRKWGFRVPLKKWFESDLNVELKRLLGVSDSFVAAYGDRDAVDGLLAEHEAGVEDHHMVLWTILACEAWFQNRSDSVRSCS